jgi:uncharacterized protein (DUF58 family)
VGGGGRWAAIADALTTRGRCFVAAGLTALFCGLVIPEPDLIRVGVLLVVLPVLSALTASRTRYRLSCSRSLNPRRVPAGTVSTITLRLRNMSRLRTGLLMAEDTVPYSLGSKPRFLLDRIEAGGEREYDYQVRPDARGKYSIGPLRVRVADAFGLVEIGRSFATTSTLTVTPRIVPLDLPAMAGNWPGDGEQGKRTITASGADDIAPRQYRVGDSLHRVHWRSTARYGELMVRREEQHWRNSASLFLDTRRMGYAGSGPGSPFEIAVIAAASIGVHLSGNGFDARLVTDDGEVGGQGTFQDTLLDTLAVVRHTHSEVIRDGIAALAAGSGQIIAIISQLSAADARQLAAARRGNAPGLALVISPGPHDEGASVLTRAGWRVTTATSAAELPEAWHRLHGQSLAAGAPSSLMTR